MKRMALKSTLVAVLAIFVFGGVALAAHDPYRSGSTVTIPAGEVEDHSLFAAGSTLTVSGTVNGDVFCAGETVFITGTVNGDVYCAGQNVRISGTVNGNVRSAGQTITIAGTVQRAISLAGQSVSVEPDARVGGDATLAGFSVVVAGKLQRDAYATSETVTVTGSITRNLDVRSANVVTTGSTIGGVVTKYEPAKQPTHKPVDWHFVGMSLALLMHVMMLVTALVLVAIAPRRFDGLADEVLKVPGKTFVTGIIAAFLLPVAVVLLAITVVGIPLAIIMALVWILLAILCGPVFAYLVGRKLMPNARKPLGIMALGSVIVLALYIVPIINLFIGSVVYIVGIGALLGAIGRALGKPKFSL